MPAASVGVKIPPQIPPKTTKISPKIDIPDKNCSFVIEVVSPILSGSGANLGFIMALNKL